MYGALPWGMCYDRLDQMEWMLSFTRRFLYGYVMNEKLGKYNIQSIFMYCLYGSMEIC